VPPSHAFVSFVSGSRTEAATETRRQDQEFVLAELTCMTSRLESSDLFKITKDSISIIHLYSEFERGSELSVDFVAFSRGSSGSFGIYKFIPWEVVMFQSYLVPSKQVPSSRDSKLIL